MVDKIPSSISRQHILNAIAGLDSGKEHAFGESTDYDVLYEGRRYAPKAVIGLAAEEVLGVALGPYDFKGGLNTRCFRTLKKNGFTIVPKDGTYPRPDVSNVTFIPGQVYNRVKDIHQVYGGQRQGGMSTPADYPFIFLFTGSNGETHGYHDEFRDDGTFWYTGEGQSGDMKFIRANLALRDHVSNGKEVHVFEAAGNGVARYIGEMEYLGHHFEERPDTNGDARQAIIFELGLVGESSTGDGTIESPPDVKVLRNKSLAELKELAIRGSTSSATSKTRRQTVMLRSAAVREYVLRRANGKCEGCSLPAPFLNKKGAPYLEPHHTTRVADGGPDHPSHVIGLCPTCHRKVHHGKGGEELNHKFKIWLQEHDPEIAVADPQI